MSEFLKFAYELLSQVVYNIVTWLAGISEAVYYRMGGIFSDFPYLFSDTEYSGKDLVSASDADAVCQFPLWLW